MRHQPVLPADEPIQRATARLQPPLFHHNPFPASAPARPRGPPLGRRRTRGPLNPGNSPSPPTTSQLVGGSPPLIPHLNFTRLAGVGGKVTGTRIAEQIGRIR